MADGTPLTIRPFRSAADARPQYGLWLAATESLPRAWRSCLRNTEHQLANAAKHPRSRLYAERPDGSLAGYVGVHPPFEWIAEDHGPPARSLGWAIPFGFPWTHPLDESLEIALYDRMREAVLAEFASFRRDVYVQRFRESWTRITGWLTGRGWRLHERLPLLGREVGDPGPAPRTEPVTRADLGWIADLTTRDPTSPALTRAGLESRYDAGWIVHDTFRKVSDAGAFAIEARARHAAITFLCANPASWDRVLAAAAREARALGAREIYFTTDPARDHALIAALLQRDFAEVDAGVYYLCDAD